VDEVGERTERLLDIDVGLVAVDLVEVVRAPGLLHLALLLVGVVSE
jgi:hypothetical protein